jgi:hypothetical protein
MAAPVPLPADPGLVPNDPRSSATYSYNPTGSEMVLEAFSRIQMRARELDSQHIIEARRSLNLMFAHLPNRGPSLWLIGDQPLVIPNIPGQSTYPLPSNTVDIYDAWRRSYTPDANYQAIGYAPLIPMTANGRVMVTGTGSVMVLGPGSGTLSSVAGSTEVTLHWQSHGLRVGSPLFWQNWTEIGGFVLSNFNVVDQVIDQNTVTFQVSAPVPETSTLQGGTGCIQTSAGSSLVDIILPGHGLSVGDMFPINTPTTVAGFTIPVGLYPVTGVVNGYDFQIEPQSGYAYSTDAGFIADGQVWVTSQAGNSQWVDIFLWPMSRTDYSMLPDKMDIGFETQYWFNRTINPSVTLWPVPPPVTANQYNAFMCYRMRRVMDFNPQSGQVSDLPSRMWDWGAAELCARMAEKFKPMLHQVKLQLATVAWQEASAEDREKVAAYVAPQIGVYF